MRYVLVVFLSLVFLVACTQNSQLIEDNFSTAASSPNLSDIGSKVWLDANEDGIKQTPEKGIEGITVNLWLDVKNDGIPDDKLASQLTDSRGIYRFNALNPDQNYIVEVIPPENYVFSNKNNNDAPGEDWDSDINPELGYTDSIDVVKGKYTYTIDAAVYDPKNEQTATPAKLGAKVWLDKNKDGVKQSNEPGLPNITLNLWSTNPDLTPNKIIQTKTTDSQGRYRFTNLIPNKAYLLQPVLPEGYGFTQKDNPDASTEYYDSDINPDTGLSDPIILKPWDFNVSYNPGLILLESKLEEIASFDYGIYQNETTTVDIFGVSLSEDMLAVTYRLNTFIDINTSEQNDFIDIYEFLEGSWQLTFTFDDTTFSQNPEGAMPYKYFYGTVDQDRLAFSAIYRLADPPSEFNSGFFIFERANGVWEQQALLQSSETSEGGCCSDSDISLDGDRIVIPKRGGGERAIYQEVNGQWLEAATIAGLSRNVVSGNRVVTKEFGFNNCLVYEEINNEWLRTEQIPSCSFFDLQNDTFVKIDKTLNRDPSRAQVYQFVNGQLQDTEFINLSARGLVVPHLDEDRLVLDFREARDDEYQQIIVFEKESEEWVEIDQLRLFNQQVSEVKYGISADNGYIAVARNLNRFDHFVDLNKVSIYKLVQ